MSIYTQSCTPSRTTKKINESIGQSLTLSFDSWVTDRKPVITDKEYQLDIGSAPNINVPLYLIAAYQATQGDNPARPRISLKMLFLKTLM